MEVGNHCIHGQRSTDEDGKVSREVVMPPFYNASGEVSPKVLCGVNGVCGNADSSPYSDRVPRSSCASKNVIIHSFFIMNTGKAYVKVVLGRTARS